MTGSAETAPGSGFSSSSSIIACMIFCFMRQGRVAGHADLAHEVHRRDALLALRNQENGLEPGRERKLRVLEQRSGGDGCLSPALGALPQVPVIEPAVLRSRRRVI
ncbi:MAG: hypothetical protein OXC26_09885 [Albidovulum sp.]|nr:hypothetical protein [Albidovulum sp.]